MSTEAAPLTLPAQTGAWDKLSVNDRNRDTWLHALPQLHGFSHLSGKGLDPFLKFLNKGRCFAFYFFPTEPADLTFAFHTNKKCIHPSFCSSGPQSCQIHISFQYAWMLTRRTSHSYFSWAFVSSQINRNTFTLKVYEHILKSGKKNPPVVNTSSVKNVNLKPVP